jgi:hypothetical protein
MSRTTLAVLVILTVALAAWAGDTGLGTSPFTSGDQLTATAVNAMNDAINDNQQALAICFQTLQMPTQPARPGQPLTPSKIWMCPARRR